MNLGNLTITQHFHTFDISIAHEIFCLVNDKNHSLHPIHHAAL